MLFECYLSVFWMLFEAVYICSFECIWIWFECPPGVLRIRFGCVLNDIWMLLKWSLNGLRTLFGRSLNVVCLLFGWELNVMWMLCECVCKGCLDFVRMLLEGSLGVPWMFCMYVEFLLNVECVLMLVECDLNVVCTFFEHSVNALQVLFEWSLNVFWTRFWMCGVC